MIVKISVKKLHRMEEMYKNRIKANRRTYLAEVAGWRTENEALKKKVGEMFNDRKNFEEDLERADKSLTRMDERLQAYRLEADEKDETIKDLTDKCEALDAQCEALKLEVEDRKKQCVVLDEYGDAKTEESEMLKDTVNALKRVIEQLKH